MGDPPRLLLHLCQQLAAAIEDTSLSYRDLRVTFLPNRLLRSRLDEHDNDHAALNNDLVALVNLYQTDYPQGLQDWLAAAREHYDLFPDVVEAVEAVERAFDRPARPLPAAASNTADALDTGFVPPWGAKARPSEPLDEDARRATADRLWRLVDAAEADLAPLLVRAVALATVLSDETHRAIFELHLVGLVDALGVLDVARLQRNAQAAVEIDRGLRGGGKGCTQSAGLIDAVLRLHAQGRSPTEIGFEADAVRPFMEVRHRVAARVARFASAHLATLQRAGARPGRARPPSDLLPLPAE